MAIRNEAKNALEYSGHKKCSCKRGKRWQLNCFEKTIQYKTGYQLQKPAKCIFLKNPNRTDVILH